MTARQSKMVKGKGPKYQSSFIKRLQELDPPVDLLGPNSATARAYNGTKLVPASFDFPDAPPGKKRVPSSLEVNRTGAKMAFRIMGKPVATRILLEIKIGGANISRKCETRLEFYTGIPEQVKDLGYHVVYGESDTAQKSPHGIIVHWKTVGGIGTRIGISLPKFDAETKETLALMRALADNSLHNDKSVRVFVAYETDLELALKEIAGNLTISLPWKHHWTNSFRPLEDLTMRQRSIIHEQCGGLIRYPTKNSFASPEEAHIILAYAIALEYRHAPLKAPRHHWPGTEKNEDYLFQQLRALIRLFDVKMNQQVKDLWWPMILNQRLDLLTVRVPTWAFGSDAEAVRSKMLQVLDTFNWSQEQHAALWESQNFHGPVQILQGPPGSGKTQLLAGRALFFALNGFSVLVCAPTAPVAKAFATCFKKLDLARGATGGIPHVTVVELFPFEPDYEEMKTEKRDADIQHANILITMPNFIASKACCAFGTKSSGIIVIHEDSDHLAEPELLATVFALDHYKTVQGLILSTDIREWPMDLATLTDPERQIKRAGEKENESLDSVFFRYFYRYSKTDAYDPESIKKSGEISFLYGQNEFADQLGLPLVTRLLRQNFPCTKLEDQHRINTSLKAFPSLRAYKCEAFSKDRVSETLSLSGQFQAVIQSWLGSKVPQVLTRLFINTDDPGNGIKSVCQKARDMSESKSNTRNVEVVMDLLIQNHKLGGPPASDIKIVCPYADQLRCYMREYKKVAKQLGRQVDEFPEVKTVDSMEGQQAPIIIYDLVVTCGDKSHGIGIVAEEFRANLVATRATDVFIIVGSSEILTIFPNFWKELMRFNGTKEPLPYIVEYIQTLDKEGLRFTAPTPDGKKEDYIPPKQCWKKHEGDFEGAWERRAHFTPGFDPGRGE